MTEILEFKDIENYFQNFDVFYEKLFLRSEI